MSRLDDIRAEMQRRLELRRQIEQSPESIASALDHYKGRLVEWVQDWCWTYDPRNREQDAPVYVPFDLADRQREYLDWRRRIRNEGKHGQTPKSRGVGASYLACAHHLHCWLFEDGYSGTLVAQKEDQVDRRDDPDSLFQKLRIMIDYLPWWQVPDGWSGLRGEHDNHRRIINPENNSTIVGNIGKNPGRGGRSSMADIDEAAHCENLTEIRRAMNDNAACTFEISTYNGMGESFYTKTHSGSTFVESFKITWRDIPFYDDEWYAKKKEQFADDPVGFAQEVECDPASSQERTVCPAEWVKVAMSWEPGDEAPGGPKKAALDVAGGGANLNVLAVRKGIEVTGLHASEEASTTQTAWWAHGLCEDRGIGALIYDAVGIGAGVGDTLEASGRSALDVTDFLAGGSPSDDVWPNGRSSKERFVDARSELWWKVRDRLRKTYERLKGGKGHPVEECIVLPDSPELREQLPQPTYDHTSGGKISVESKENMQDRGIASPDHADAAVMTEVDVRSSIPMGTVYY